MTYIPTGVFNPLDRPTREGLKPLTMATKPFIDGPRVVVGPFSFGVKGSRMTFSQQWFGSAAGMPVQKWIGARMGSLREGYERRLCKINWKTGQIQDPDRGCPRNWKTWSIDRWIPRSIWEGEMPLAKTKHPQTGEWWGVYAKFGTGEFTITFKKIPEDWLVRLWKGIKAVVSFIVDTVKSLFELLKGVACALARQKLNQLEADINNRNKTAKQIAAGLGVFGVKEKDIKKLQNAPNSETAAAVGNAIVTSVCGTPPPVVAEGHGSPWLLWLAAGGVALIAGAVLLKKGGK